MTIPPASERMTKPCAVDGDGCIFYRWDERNGHWCCYDYSDLNLGRENIRHRPSKSCKMRISVQEMRECVNHFNKQEQQE